MNLTKLMYLCLYKVDILTFCLLIPTLQEVETNVAEIS